MSTAFVACIESGVLETQAILLFESIRRHTGALAGAPTYAFSPRAGHEISSRARRRLEELEVTHIDAVLNTECVEYGSANRVLAAAYAETHYRQDTLVVLDSDTLFLREPRAFALAPDADVAVRPVDVKGMCTTGPHDPADAYWQKLAALCGTRLDVLPLTRSFVDNVRIRASYNGGLVVARTHLGIMQRWADFFLRSVRAGLRPHREGSRFRTGAGWVEPTAGRWWGSNQAALSLAIWSSTRGVVELPATYNYPLHSHAEVDAGARALVFERLVHVHYHWLFAPDALAANPLFGAPSPLSAEQRKWLGQPLQPKGRAPR